jgi:hypothetical protein
MITGGTGNEDVGDPGWPAGAATAFNTKQRIAWWEDPPFGGGRWHAECQGDADQLSQWLVDFAQIQSVPKRVVLRDGVGRSFWLDPNQQQALDRSLQVDWVFVIWQRDRWDFQKQLRRGVTALHDPTEVEPVAELIVYTGGDVDWSRVTVPDGIAVSDERLEAHGFKPADGSVIEGRLTTVDSDMPLMASITLETVEPQAEGGYQHRTIAATASDADGRWIFQHLPPGWLRVVARCEGYAPRVLKYLSIDSSPQWQCADSQLAKSACLRGKVVDPSDQPLENADVHFDDPLYESPDGYTATTDAQGDFAIDGIPRGTGSVWAYRSGYCRRGLRQQVQLPSEPIIIALEPAGSMRVSVLLSKPRAGDYVVRIRDARGKEPGTWGGSGNLNADDWIDFTDIPAGKYVVSGQPNPGSADRRTDEIEVEVVGGQRVELQIRGRE